MQARPTIARAEAEEDLRSVLTIVAHDLRAPAHHVNGFVGLLTEHLAEHFGDAADETVQTYANCLAGAAADIDQKLTALTRYSNATAGAGELAAVDLAVIAGETVAASASALAEAGLETAIVGAATTLGHSETLVAMLCELLDNAAKFAIGGSLVTIALAEEASNTVVTVSDDGPGIEAIFAKESTRLFRRYHPDTVAGRGAGLAIVERIARLHGGNVAITTDTDRGFSAQIELPLTQGCHLAPEALERRTGTELSELG